MHDPSEARERAVHRLVGSFRRKGHPGLLLFFFVSLTGLAGFLASALLRLAGLTAMWARYPLAVGVAYLVFLALIGLWLASYRHRHAPAAPPGSGDVWWWWYYGDVLTDPGPGSPAPSVAPAETPSASGGGGGGGGSGFSLGDGEGILILVVVLIGVALVSAALATVYVVAEAPVLLAEVLVDGLLMVGVARRLQAASRHPHHHWVVGVLRRTWLPVAAVALMFGVIGYGLEQLVPGATTMGEAVRLAGRPPAPGPGR